MRSRRLVVPLVVLALVASLVVPSAVAGKKKKPKPWKSEEGSIAVPHTMLISSTGERNNVTLREFEARCAIPATNGLDGYVYEVPKEYQTIPSKIAARGSGGTRALYIILYDKDCQMQMYFTGSDAIPSTEDDTEGAMPPGIAYVGLANFFGHPQVTVWVELKP
ncbi:MAG: hypothetical protein ACRDI3_03560 [Actinomycetota bacterium]